jgi:hypothetical protein
MSLGGKVRIQGGTDSYIAGGRFVTHYASDPFSAFASNETGFILGMDNTVSKFEVGAGSSNYIRFQSTGTPTLDIKAETFEFGSTDFKLSNTIVKLGTIDSVTDIDARQDFDGTASVDTNAEVFVQTSQDATSYSGFQKFANGTFKGRAFKFKCVLTTQDTNQDIRVTQLGYFAEFQRRTEQSATAISSGAGAKAITFDKAFFTGTSALNGVNSSLPSIGITAQNMASGDYFEVTNVSGTGFTVHFKNSSNASISRNFNYSAVGFGKGA